MTQFRVQSKRFMPICANKQYDDDDDDDHVIYDINNTLPLPNFNCHFLCKMQLLKSQQIDFQKLFLSAYCFLVIDT